MSRRAPARASRRKMDQIFAHMNHNISTSQTDVEIFEASRTMTLSRVIADLTIAKTATSGTANNQGIYVIHILRKGGTVPTLSLAQGSKAYNELDIILIGSFSLNYLHGAMQSFRQSKGQRILRNGDKVYVSTIAGAVTDDPSIDGPIRS